MRRIQLPILSIIRIYVGGRFHYDVLQLTDEHFREGIDNGVENIRWEGRGSHRHTPRYGVNGGAVLSAPLLRERNG